MEVISELVPGPPLLPFPVTVLHDGGVLHKGHVPAPLHQAPEGPRVPVVVLHRRPARQLVLTAVGGHFNGLVIL